MVGLRSHFIVVVASLGVLSFFGCDRAPLEAGDAGGVAGGGPISSSPDARPLGSVVCAGVTCFASQICCIGNGTCVDKDAATITCPKPGASPGTSAPGMSQSGKVCGSNADCGASEFCMPDKGCLGAGTCADRNGCGSSAGAMGYCGCDGVTYPTVQRACLAGVATLGDPGGCGVPMDTQSAPGSSGAPRDPIIYCGLDRQCPTGEKCCAITGRCYDSQVPYLCGTPPPGTKAPCLEDRQCAGGEYCSGDGCSGQGGCINQAGGCDGRLDPVCGCDGKSYTSASCLLPLGIRVAYKGVCGDGGIDSGG
jgi:hypothetical protein